MTTPRSENINVDSSNSAAPVIPEATSRMETLTESAKQTWVQTKEKLYGTTGKAKTAIEKIAMSDLLNLMNQFLDSAGSVGKNISGKTFVDAAAKLLSQQMQYNNILATRLAEALEDIETLKVRVRDLEKKI